MQITNLLVVCTVWMTTQAQNATGNPGVWVSCKACREGFLNITFNWRCKYGCDRFYARPITRPVSITKPSAQPHNTRNGSYLDCKECFGHGVNPSADPRCKYGCGRFMTYPSRTYGGEKHKLTVTESPDTESYEAIKITDGSDENTLNVNPTEPTLRSINSLKKASLRYKHLILLIGLFVGATATLAGYVLYRKRYRINKKTNTDIAIVMQNV